MTGPTIVIHGGAGNSVRVAYVDRKYLTPERRKQYLSSLARILRHVWPCLESGEFDALEAATAAVKLFEDDELFNAGKGAVFTLEGKNELEASVMVSHGYDKRAAGAFLLRTVKHPILFAKELLCRKVQFGGTRHLNLSGEYAETLANDWGLDIVDPSYFYTERRWQEHLRGLKGRKPTIPAVATEADGVALRQQSTVKLSVDDDERTLRGSVSENDYQKLVQVLKAEPHKNNNIDVDEKFGPLSKGTVGCVCLDVNGVIASATSTGGLTNKLPGRIGDTPSIGCGFWAEEWTEEQHAKHGFMEKLSQSTCLPVSSTKPAETRAVGLSGTGNGDYFLRFATCHNIASRCRFGGVSLKEAAQAVVGPKGEMAKGRPGNGSELPEDGVIGLDEKGNVVMVMNSAGMFRGTIVDGKVMVAAFADEPLEEWLDD